MTHLITFSSDAWAVSAETPNPINPIVGQGLLRWLREQLSSAGYDASEPEPEDWGWYLTAKCGDKSYLVGASSEIDASSPREWTVQRHRERSLFERVLCRNKLQADEPLCFLLEELIRAHPLTRSLRVHKDP